MLNNGLTLDNNGPSTWYVRAFICTKTSAIISAVSGISHCTERLEKEFITVDNTPGLIFQTSDG